MISLTVIASRYRVALWHVALAEEGQSIQACR